MMMMMSVPVYIRQRYTVNRRNKRGVFVVYIYSASLQLMLQRDVTMRRATMD